MKKIIFACGALLIFGFWSSSVKAQSQEKNSNEEASKVLKINMVITKDGETKTINKEVIIPEGVDIDQIIQEMENLEDNHEANENVKVRVGRFHGKEAQKRAYMDNEKVLEKRAFLGVVGYTINANTDNPKQVRLTRIIENGPAAKAGLKNEDILKSFDGNSVTTYQNLIEQIRRKKPGESVDVVVIRDGKELSFTVILDEHETRMHHKEMVKRMRFNGDEMNLKIELEIEEISPSEMNMIEKSVGVNKKEGDQFQEVELEMFPNPTKDNFEYSLQLEEGGKLEVILLNQDGKQISKEEVKSKDGLYKGKFSLKEEPSGIYFLVFKRGDKVITEKIVKQ